MFIAYVNSPSCGCMSNMNIFRCEKLFNCYLTQIVKNRPAESFAQLHIYIFLSLNKNILS